MGKKILVVDDSSSMRKMVRYSLEEEGYEIMEAKDGSEGLAMLDSVSELKLIITDVNMPNMNGLELVAAMRKDELLKSVPVLVITTEGNQVRLNEFKEKGVSGYIKKPFTPEEIRLKLHEILGEVHHDQGSEIGNDGIDF